MAMTEKDPVCGMDVDPANAAGESEFEGKAFYFCSSDCKQKFDANPAQFAGDRSQGTTAG